MNTINSDISSILHKCGKRPWSVKEYPNGEPFIQDADGYPITQVAWSILYGNGNYINRNRDHAELICAAVNALGQKMTSAPMTKPDAQDNRPLYRPLYGGQRCSSLELAQVLCDGGKGAARITLPSGEVLRVPSECPDKRLSDWLDESVGKYPVHTTPHSHTEAATNQETTADNNQVRDGVSRSL